MHEVPRLIPTILEYLRTVPLKYLFLQLPLDSNRVARTLRAFKIGIEREFVISVEGRVFIKNKNRTFKNCLTKTSPIALVCNQINYLPVRLANG